MANNNRDKKIVSFILCLFLGGLGIHKFYEGKIGMGILYIFTFGLFGIGWLVDIIKLLIDLVKGDSANQAKNVSVSQPKVTSTTTYMPTNTQKKATLADGEKDYNLLEDIVDKYALRYKYEKDICIFDNNVFNLVKGQGGKQIEFRPEPDNEKDPYAIAIYLNDNKLGYVYRDQTQDMMHSWIDRGLPFVGYINKFSEIENKITYKIGFYFPLAKFESKKIKLVGTTKRIDEFETRADNLTACSEGNCITIEQDLETEKHIVFKEGYSEIGELPKSATTFIEENEHKNIIGIIDEITYDEKPSVTVTIYLIR